MGNDSSWRGLVDAYEAALREFERVSNALSAGVLDRSASGETFAELFDAEAKARKRVLDARARLIETWRDNPGLDLNALLSTVDR